MTYDYSRDAVRVAVGAVEEDDKFLELEAADYITFLLALDTYHRWVKESGRPQHDPVLIRGLTLLRMAERDHLDKVGAVIRDGVKNPASLTMLAAALRLPPTHKGASIRALKLRTILSRGGPTTVKHVFGSSTRARREVNDAIESSMGDDAATAFLKFSTIVLKDKRLQGWIARAAASTASGGEPLPVETSIVHEASKQVGESADELLKAKAQQDAHPPTS